MNGVLYQKNTAKSYIIQDFDRIVTDVKKITNDDDKIFGSYIITPIIALESDREIINNEADTNYQRFLTGLLSSDKATRLATESAVFFQFADIGEECGSAVALNPAHLHQNVIVDNCELYRRYKVEWLGHNELFMWRCSR